MPISCEICQCVATVGDATKEWLSCVCHTVDRLLDMTRCRYDMTILTATPNTVPGRIIRRYNLSSFIIIYTNHRLVEVILPSEKGRLFKLVAYVMGDTTVQI